MERQAGTQNSGDDDPVFGQLHGRHAQGRLHRPGCETERLRNLVGRDLADALHVAAETHRIGLHRLVADLGDELVENRVLLAEDMQLHNNLRFDGQ